MTALSHLRVIDLSRVLAGPLAGQILADLGADVIKVESPEGDDTRKWGPPYLKDRDGESTAESAYFLAANRGKKSVCIDLKTESGQAQLRELLAEADILIENFKTGGLSKYGFDYEQVSKINPGLIYCSITGFGQTGPYSQRPGYDFLMQAMGGLMSITGESDDNQGQPQKIGVALSDVMTGLYAVIGILTALTEREKSGRGQQIDLSLLDVTVASLANQATNYLIGDIVPGRMGNAHPNVVPYQAFATSDGHCIVAVGNDAQFRAFSEVLEQPELADDPRFATNEGRVTHRETLIEITSSIMSGHDRDYWLTRFETAGVPAGPINDIADVFADPQVIARGMKIDLSHPLADQVNLVGNPLNFSRTPLVYETAPPLLGADSDDILKED